MSNPMTEDFESTVHLNLAAAGGPPELAPQLAAIATQRDAAALLAHWIVFHIGPEWSAMQFDQWVTKYRQTEEEIKQRSQPQ